MPNGVAILPNEAVVPPNQAAGGLNRVAVLPNGAAVGLFGTLEIAAGRLKTSFFGIFTLFPTILTASASENGGRFSFKIPACSPSRRGSVFGVRHTCAFMQKKHVIVVSGLVVLACIALWFFRPSPSYDLSRVEPRLSSLKEPYQHVKTAYYLDGGSIGIEITDRDGKIEQFAIPAHLGDTNRYTLVYVGAIHDRKPGAVLVSDSVQTKRMLIHVLASMPQRTYWDDVDLMLLRRRPADFVHCFILKISGADRP